MPGNCKMAHAMTLLPFFDRDDCADSNFLVQLSSMGDNFPSIQIVLA
jgi:hypothetical protein